MEKHPAVSIVICTRNRAESLGGTLHSLSQIVTSHEWEALIVDNASTDDTIGAIKAADNCAARLRWLRVDRIGLGAARDAAWRQTRAGIVAFTDDDCYLQPDYVNAMVETFASYPEAGCIGGRILLFDSEDVRATIDERETANRIEPCRFVSAGELHGANLAFRRATLERINGFDPDLGAGTRYPCEDIDAVAAVVWTGIPAHFDPRPVVFHHHGRREADLGRLQASYDYGRGAYYAKYILRSDTRRAYLRGWWGQVSFPCDWNAFIRLSREMAAAASYVVHRRRYGFLVAATPVALLVYSIIGACVVLRAIASRLRKRRRPTPSMMLPGCPAARE